MSAHAPPDSYKEAVGGYYDTHPGLEVAPQQTKPAWAVNQTQAEVLDRENTICGLRRATFLLSLALAFVIIAAAVGGGVGGSLAVQSAMSSCKSNNTSSENFVQTVTVTATAAAADLTASSTVAAPIVVPTGVVKLDCPNGLNDNIAITLGSDMWVFTPACNIDYTGSDFAAVIVYSFHDCLQACAAHNHFSGKNECTALSFRANQTEEIPINYGNCWLKSGSPKGNAVSGADENLAAAAVLKSFDGQ
ncbi:hypothetical protein F5Y19DRAFT_89313 [Xylariaceae sp. FL1651]|nr:hypothetical protein F5Y19DRAFT_89313 [Xylariaceae sp. FL1651]